ncbi:MAG: hypothetical protein PSV26_03035 [Polaromonas sp.]|uniref:hypothetical protein n=1 Tax=Polaromonas sp. TaxID=1869339 RepID=UPI0024892563|nr:hypothetical protein [Polaromonas sp.]MDI1236441.1 hypothetical protein [Polaromonas sp.]
MSSFEHLVLKIGEAASNGPGWLSTGEALAAALALNRSDWLAKMGYTIPQALEHGGTEWAAMIPAAADAIRTADATLAVTAKSAADETAMLTMTAGAGEIEVNASLVTYGNAPGYRDVSFTMDVQRLRTGPAHRLNMSINAQGSQRMAEHVLEVHRLAWSDGGPLDKVEGEQRPRWIGPF